MGKHKYGQTKLRCSRPRHRPRHLELELVLLRHLPRFHMDKMLFCVHLLQKIVHEEILLQDRAGLPLFFSSREVPALPGRAEVVAVLDGVDALAADVAAAGEAHRRSRLSASGS